MLRFISTRSSRRRGKIYSLYTINVNTCRNSLCIRIYTFLKMLEFAFAHVLRSDSILSLLQHEEADGGIDANAVELAVMQAIKSTPGK